MSLTLVVVAAILPLRLMVAGCRVVGLNFLIFIMGQQDDDDDSSPVFGHPAQKPMRRIVSSVYEGDRRRVGGQKEVVGDLIKRSSLEYYKVTSFFSAAAAAVEDSDRQAAGR